MDTLHFLKHNTSFIIVWGCYSLSLIATNVGYIAMLNILASMTFNPLAYVLITIIEESIPIIFSPFISIVADLKDQRWIMLLSTLFAGLSVVGYWLAWYYQQLSVVYITAAIKYLSLSFYLPAMYCYIPLIVSKKNLIISNTLLAISMGLFTNIFSSIGGLINSYWGIYPGLGVDLVANILASVLIILLFTTYWTSEISDLESVNNKINSRNSSSRDPLYSIRDYEYDKLLSESSFQREDTFIAMMGQFYYYLKTKRLLLKVLGVTTAYYFVLGAIQLVDLRLASYDYVLKTPGLTLGVSYAVMAFGAITGSIIIKLYLKIRPETDILKMITPVLIISVFSLILLCASTTLLYTGYLNLGGVIMWLMMDFGINMVKAMLDIVIVTYIQTETDIGIQGRIFAFLEAVTSISFIIGNVCYGLVLQQNVLFRLCWLNWGLLIYSILLVSVWSAIEP